MGNTIYVDSSAAAGGDGSLSSPYSNLKQITNDNIAGGGGNVVNISGRHYLWPLYSAADEFFTTFKSGVDGDPNIYQQWSGKPQAEIYAGVRVDNNSSYQWVDKYNNGEFQLRSTSGGDTGIPMFNDSSSATVDGYYRVASCTTANRKKEQMARHDEGSQTEAIFIGSLEELEFGIDFARDAGTTNLSYQTFWFKPEAGKTPDDYEIIISTSAVNSSNAELGSSIVIAHNYTTLQNLHILGGSQHGITLKGAGNVVRQCILANADQSNIEVASDSADVLIESCIMSQSHQAVIINKDATTKIYNCVFHNNHLGVRMNGAAAAESQTTIKNCLGIANESGAIYVKNAFTGSGSLTETNNCWYPRLNDSPIGTNCRLAYLSAANQWETTNADDIPASLSTRTAFGSPTAINKYKQTFIDPKVVAMDLHDWRKCDFHLQEDSPCIGAGINRNSDSNVPLTDLDGVSYGNSTINISKPNINIGCYQTVGTGKGSSTPADNVLINYLTEETIAPAFVLNPGESAEIFCDPVLKKGESIQGTEGGGSIGTVINEFGSFGKVSNRKTSSQSYVLTKSLTKAPTRVSYE